MPNDRLAGFDLESDLHDGRRNGRSQHTFFDLRFKVFRPTKKIVYRDFPDPLRRGERAALFNIAEHSPFRDPR